MGRALGVSGEQTRALPRYRESPAFSVRERLVLELAVAMTAAPVEGPSMLRNALRQHFTEASSWNWRRRLHGRSPK